MNYPKFLLVITSFMILFAGCMEIKEEKYTPQYACPGDDIWIQIKLSHKADQIILTDGNDQILKSKKRAKKLNFTVHNITEGQLPLTVKMSKERDYWWNWKKTLVAPVEVFPTEQWSSGIETVELEVSKELKTRSYDKLMEECECIKWNEDESECLEQKCRTYTECLTDYTFLYAPQKIKWVLPDWNFSEKIKVGGLHNSSPYPIILTINNEEFLVAANSEKRFDINEIRNMSITSNVPPELQKVRECSTITRCCDGIKCETYTPFHRDDYPEAMSCFDELTTSVKLLLICEGEKVN